MQGYSTRSCTGLINYRDELVAKLNSTLSLCITVEPIYNGHCVYGSNPFKTVIHRTNIALQCYSLSLHTDGRVRRLSSGVTYSSNCRLAQNVSAAKAFISSIMQPSLCKCQL